MENLKFSADEINYLKEAVPFLPAKYLEFLADFKLDPRNQVVLKFDEEVGIEVLVKGSWVGTILYEIPILALVSEAYFKFVDKSWTYEGQLEKAVSKAQFLVEKELPFSEFGTRRRRSFKTQELVVEGIVKGANGSPFLLGTSNVLLAKQHNLKPIGTVAHEWMMGIAAYTQDYAGANKRAMDCWLKTVGNSAAGFALTDTFGTENFLKALRPPYSDIYLGVRQDSGDPLNFTKMIADHYYKDLKYPENSKKIIYSDSLDLEKCETYRDAAKAVGLVASFGIGTFFTNDFISTATGHKSTPLNIVIKISKVNGNPAVKISDNINKNMGDKSTVDRVKQELGYTEKTWSGGDESHRWDEK